MSVIKKYLEDNFGEVYRARISVMPPGHELFWHIDTDTSVLCRMQLAIRAEGSEFQFRNRKTFFFCLQISFLGLLFVFTHYMV